MIPKIGVSVEEAVEWLSSIAKREVDISFFAREFSWSEDARSIWFFVSRRNCFIELAVDGGEIVGLKRLSYLADDGIHRNDCDAWERNPLGCLSADDLRILRDVVIERSKNAPVRPRDVEIVEVLKKIACGAIEISSFDEELSLWTEPNIDGIVGFTAEGYYIRIFVDAGEVDYVDLARTPDGREGVLDYWEDYADGQQDPVEYLTSDEKRMLKAVIVKRTNDILRK